MAVKGFLKVLKNIRDKSPTKKPNTSAAAAAAATQPLARPRPQPDGYHSSISQFQLNPNPSPPSSPIRGAGNNYILPRSGGRNFQPLDLTDLLDSPSLYSSPTKANTANIASKQKQPAKITKGMGGMLMYPAGDGLFITLNPKNNQISIPEGLQVKDASGRYDEKATHDQFKAEIISLKQYAADNMAKNKASLPAQETPKPVDEQVTQTKEQKPLKSILKKNSTIGGGNDPEVTQNKDLSDSSDSDEVSLSTAEQPKQANKLNDSKLPENISRKDGLLLYAHQDAYGNVHHISYNPITAEIDIPDELKSRGFYNNYDQEGTEKVYKEEIIALKLCSIDPNLSFKDNSIIYNFEKMGGKISHISCDQNGTIQFDEDLKLPNPTEYNEDLTKHIYENAIKKLEDAALLVFNVSQEKSQESKNTKANASKIFFTQTGNAARANELWKQLKTAEGKPKPKSNLDVSDGAAKIKVTFEE